MVNVVVDYRVPTTVCECGRDTNEDQLVTKKCTLL